MNLTKAAARLALMVALVAAGYRLYLSTVIRNRYEKAASNCATCTAVKEVVASNWRSVESSIELLKAQKKIGKLKKLRKNMPAKGQSISRSRARTVKCPLRTTPRQPRSHRWDCLPQRSCLEPSSPPEH